MHLFTPLQVDTCITHHAHTHAHIYIHTNLPDHHVADQFAEPVGDLAPPPPLLGARQHHESGFAVAFRAFFGHSSAEGGGHFGFP